MYQGSQILVAPQLVPSAADFLLRDGTRALTANWDAGSFQIRAETFQSDVATGTAPLVVASTTKVANLNADQLDGLDSTAFATAAHNHAASDITSGTLAHERGGLEFDASAITTGGLIRGASAGVMSILTVGTDGQVLTVQADGSVAWEDAVGTALDTLELKASVKAATTANITLSGEQTIDGVALVSGDRVLVKDQTTASQNGIYVVDDYGWTRASDYAAASLAAATFGHIQQGTANGDKKWLCTNNTGGDTVGTHNLTFSLGAGTSGDVTGPASSTDNAIARFNGTGGKTLQNSSATVDDNGRVIAATGSNGGFGFSGVTGTYIIWGTTEVIYRTEVGGLSAGIFIGDRGAIIAGSLLLNSITQGSADTAINWTTANCYEFTLAGNVSVTFTPPAYKTGTTTKWTALYLKVIQDATGNRTITWPSTVFWPGGTPPTLSAGANAVDLFTFIYDGTNYHGATHSLDSQV